MTEDDAMGLLLHAMDHCITRADGLCRDCDFEGVEAYVRASAILWGAYVGVATRFRLLSP
jgi:hypothetical protein